MMNYLCCGTGHCYISIFYWYLSDLLLHLGNVFAGQLVLELIHLGLSVVQNSLHSKCVLQGYIFWPFTPPLTWGGFRPLPPPIKLKTEERFKQKKYFERT